MFTEILSKYKKRGWFERYPSSHIIYPALTGQRPVSYESDNDYVKGIKYAYDTFIANFVRVLLYMDRQLEPDNTEWIVRYYLACTADNANREFLIRYSNVLVMCGIYSFHSDIKKCKMEMEGDVTVFRFIYKDDTVIQFYSAVIDRGSTREKISRGYLLEPEVGFKQRELLWLRDRLEEEQIFLADTLIGRLTEALAKGEALSADSHVYTVCLLHVVSDDVETHSILPVEGLLTNPYTGIFRKAALHDEYQFKAEHAQNINAALVCKRSGSFLLYGDIRYLLNREHSFVAVNALCRQQADADLPSRLYPFTVNERIPSGFCVYPAGSQEMIAHCQYLIGLLLEDYKPPVSSVFSNKEVLLIESFICKNFIDNPELLDILGLTMEKAIEEIYKQYERMYQVFRSKYPSNHPFQSDTCLLDAMSFSFAYCMYTVPKRLHNAAMMEDFLQKKLVCAKKGLYDEKMFNESYSEFEIFFYLFVGIFIHSRRYESFVRLEYEPDGNQNKRFEYAFVFKDYEINVEVKALECAPEYADGLDLVHMKDGERFYKNYFHAYEEKDVVPDEILQNAVRLKSNYRQVSKNIKRIENKCVAGDGRIHLGFLMINYGTSREEYLSYLMNHKQGYLRKNPLNKLDALILFSMCHDTDLLMEKVRMEEHLFVFPNLKKNNDALLSDLRLDHLVCDNEDNRYFDLFDEEYGEYVGIHTNGILTVQRAGVTEEEIARVSDTIHRNEKMKEMLSGKG